MTTTTISHQRWNRDFNPSTIVAEQQLKRAWYRLNHRHFRGKLPTPKLAVYRPYRDDAYATFAGYSDGFAIIDVDPSVANGTAPIVASASTEGKYRFLEDILLHEMVHCAVYNTGRWDQQATHNGAFATLATHIGNELGLPRAKDPAGWPGTVRPDGYYAGATATPVAPACRQTPSPRPGIRADRLTAAVNELNRVTAAIAARSAARRTTRQ